MTSGHAQSVKVKYRHDLKHNSTVDVLGAYFQRFEGSYQIRKKEYYKFLL
jgi:hypothetical protein